MPTARACAWSLLCGAACLPPLLAFAFPADVSAGLVGDPSCEEALWLLCHCKRLFIDAWNQHGALAALRFAVFDGYPYFGNILHFWLLSAPLAALLPYPLWFNVQALLIAFLNATSAALLLMQQTGSRGAALFAAVALALNPWSLHLLQQGRHREALVATVGLYLVALSRVARSASSRDAIWCGLTLALCGWLYWFYGLFAGMCAALWFVARRLAGRGLLVILGVAILLAFPLAWPLLSARGTPRYPLSLPSYSQIETMPPNGAWEDIDASSLRQILRDSLSCDWVVGGAVRCGQPFVLLILAVATLLYLRTRAAPWVWVAVFFYLVSLGPNLQVGDHFWPVPHPAPLPYRLLFTTVPFLSRFYHPDRAAIFTIFSLLVLAGTFLARVEPKRARYPLLGLSLVLLVGVAALAGRSRLCSIPVPVARFYQLLADAPPGALVELPAYPRSAEWPGRSFAETLHDRTIIGCLGGYGYGGGDTFPVAGSLTAKALLGALAESGGPGFPAGLQECLRNPGVRFVVLHESGFLDQGHRFELVARMLTTRLGPPLYRDIETPAFSPPGARPTRLYAWDVTRAPAEDRPSRSSGRRGGGARQSTKAGLRATALGEKDASRASKNLP